MQQKKLNVWSKIFPSNQTFPRHRRQLWHVFSTVSPTPRCPEGASPSDLAAYDGCVGEAAVLHTQCTTDTLRNRDKLTVPLYTDHCSALCYTRGNTRGVRDCPFNGIRLDGRGTGGSQEVEAPLADKFLG